MDAGVSIDSYGRCLHNREEGAHDDAVTSKVSLLRKYKFAIAFENSPSTVRPRVCATHSVDFPSWMWVRIVRRFARVRVNLVVFRVRAGLHN